MSIEPTRLAIVDDFQAPTDEELHHVIDYLFAHRKEPIRLFLREKRLPVSGTKQDLRQRIREGLTQGTIVATDLIDLLDTIEGWGNQHIYLYKAPPGELSVWKSEERVRQRLEHVGHAKLLNRRRPLILPKEPTLSSIEWTPDRVRYIWVEKREWQLHLSDLDRDEGDIYYKAYQNHLARGITTFEWNLVSGQAALMIQRLPSGERYEARRCVYERQLEATVALSNFTRLPVRRAIRNLEASGEVRKRQVAHETQRGGRASFTSQSRKLDAYEDPDLQKSRQALGGQTTSVLGNFYWLPQSPSLARPLHVKLYAGDQRVGVFGECTEGEVNYVLSRIRHHSTAAP